MVVVVSDDYLQSKECDFQTKFALSLSPGKLSPTLTREKCADGALKYRPSLGATELTPKDLYRSLWLG